VAWTAPSDTLPSSALGSVTGDEHRRGAGGQDVAGDAAEEEPRHSSTAAGTKYDEISATLLRHRDDLARRIPIAHLRAAGGDPVFRGETFTGIETRTNLVEPLAPGTFRFVCDAHPTMS